MLRWRSMLNRSLPGAGDGASSAKVDGLFDVIWESCELNEFDVVDFVGWIGED